MKINLKPDKYYKNIFSINYDQLKKENIKYLLFDLDNTLESYYSKHTSIPTRELIEKLKKQGFKIIIISNALPWRVNKFRKELGCDGYSISRKPNNTTYLKIINKYNASKEEIICIGDQIYTDIKGAKKMKLKSILVDRISKYESILSIINRLREKIMIYNKQIVEKGKYYD